MMFGLLFFHMKNTIWFQGFFFFFQGLRQLIHEISRTLSYLTVPNTIEKFKIEIKNELSSSYEIGIHVPL